MMEPEDVDSNERKSESTSHPTLKKPKPDVKSHAYVMVTPKPLPGVFGIRHKEPDMVK
jgi:hypothetical protein